MEESTMKKSDAVVLKLHHISDLIPILDRFTGVGSMAMCHAVSENVRRLSKIKDNFWKDYDKRADREEYTSFLKERQNTAIKEGIKPEDYEKWCDSCPMPPAILNAESERMGAAVEEEISYTAYKIKMSRMREFTEQEVRYIGQAGYVTMPESEKKENDPHNPENWTPEQYQQACIEVNSLYFKALAAIGAIIDDTND